jgi:hypothetical protein
VAYTALGGIRTTYSVVDKALSQTSRRGWSPRVRWWDRKRVQNTKLCCGFSRTGFCPCGRGQYSGSLLSDLGVTPIIMTGGPQRCMYAANDTDCTCDGLLIILFKYANYDPQFTFTNWQIRERARAHTHTHTHKFTGAVSLLQSDQTGYGAHPPTSGPPIHTPARLFNWYCGCSGSAECRGEERKQAIYRYFIVQNIRDWNKIYVIYVI